MLSFFSRKRVGSPSIKRSIDYKEGIFVTRRIPTMRRRANWTGGRKKYNKHSWKWVLGQNFLGLLIVLVFFSCFGGEIGRMIVLSETLPFYDWTDRDTKECKVFTTNSEKIKELENQEPEENEMVGLDEITYQPQIEGIPMGEDFSLDNLSETVLAQLDNFDFLSRNVYLVDTRTRLCREDVDVRKFLKKDFKIDQTVKGPKILIFHTHSMEGFVDSGDTIANMDEGVYGAGEYLKELLETQYGIETLHDDGRYDMVGNKGQRQGAYERMEEPIAKILRENPSIQVTIDLHRDGLPENIHLVSTVNGKKCAKLMFCNGLCRLYKNGAVQSIEGLPNPNLEDNMAFSLQMKLALNSMSPDLTRRTYVNAYRYSTHMKPRSLLVEVGSQMNTKEEAWNAMEPLAKALSQIIQ